MNKSVQEYTLTKIKDFIKQNPTSIHFSPILKRYIALHNKGIFVDFSFNSKDATGLFLYYIRRYDLYCDEIIRSDFLSVKRSEISKIKNRLENEYERIKREEQEWNTIQNRYAVAIKGLKNEQQLYLHAQEKLVAIGWIEKEGNKLLLTEMNQLMKKRAIKENEIKLVKYLSENARNVSEVFRTHEKILFRFILKVYIDILTKEIEKMVGHPVNIRYSRNEWEKCFEKSQTFANNELYPDTSFSIFERVILTVLEKMQHRFSIDVRAQDLKYNISKNGVYERKFINRSSKYRHKKVEERYKVFGKENPSFIVALLLLNDLSVSYNRKAYENMLVFIRNNFSCDLINEYNEIVQEYQSTKKLTDFEAREMATKVNLCNKIPFIQIHKSLVKNMGYFYALKEEKYDEVIQRIEGNGRVLFFIKEQ